MQTATVPPPLTLPAGAARDIERRKSPGRFESLDIFRGMTIAGMILVNTPGSWTYVYAPLRHAEWNGWTPTDLVFPFFLFITGCAMWFSFRKFEHRPSAAVLGKIAKRVVLIFAIGLALNAFPFYNTDYSQIRILGVLQRIALAYGIAAVLCLYLKRTALIAASAGILVGYWLLLLAFGGDDPFALETNLVRTIDLAILGADHMYRGFSVPFEQMGLLSALPAAVSITLGYLAGQMIGTEPDLKRTGIKILLWGCAAVVAAYIWNLTFPINKPMWSSTYVLLSAGLAAVGLALVMWLVDMRGYTKWGHPFKVYGMNPIFAYVLSMLWAKVLGGFVRINMADGTTMSGSQWLYTQIFEPLAGPMNGSLLYAIAHVVLFWAICYVLYKRDIFVKI